MNGQKAVVASKYLKRSLELGPRSIRSIQFCAAGSDEQLIAADAEEEAAVTINGVEYIIGRNGGEGFRCCGQHVSTLEGGGQRLEIDCGDQPRLPGVNIKVVYEAPDSASVLMKHIEVVNGGTKEITVDGIEVERIKPHHTDKYKLLLEDDYVRDAMTIDGERVYSPWIEEHNKYIDAFMNTREEETRFAYPVEMDWKIAPGESFSSFKVFEFIVTNGDAEAEGLMMRKATRELFPWTRAQSLCCKIVPAMNVQQYYAAIDTAAEAGFEAVILHHGWVNGCLTSPLFTNYNDYELRDELFPGGWDDVRRLTAYAHSKGLKISFYTIYVNTWREDNQPKVLNENDWELIWDKTDDSARWGTTIDPASGWGAVVNAKILDAIERGGFDEWHLDGPYYGDISVAEGRCCKPGGPNQVLGWEHQKLFYNLMRSKCLSGEAAQGFQAFAHGMSRITTSGYNEGDFGTMSMKEQILVNRKAAYKFTYLYRPEQATTSIPVVPWSENGNAPSLLPMEDHADEYDAYLANTYGYGFEGQPYFAVAFEGPKSKKAVVRWLAFWKQHIAFFKEGYLLHVREPDGKNIDAVMHVLDKDGIKNVLVVVYNPSELEMTGELSLPLDKAGWEGREWTFKSEEGEEGNVTGDSITVTVPAFNATYYVLSQIKEQ